MVNSIFALIPASRAQRRPQFGRQRRLSGGQSKVEADGAQQALGARHHE